MTAPWFILSALAVVGPEESSFARGDAARPCANGAPNVVVILADDLGYSDLGCYGGEILTPNLDTLAAGGLRFTQFYDTGRCWPTRASLLTGYYAQQVRRDVLAGVESGGRGRRPEWAPLLPELLRPLGYSSYHSGKWHVDGKPLAGGFERSYWLQDQGRFFHPKVHYEDDVALAAVEPGRDFYATVAIADHALRCIDEHARSKESRPFFSYIAFTAPHFPLHAPAPAIEACLERYGVGWERARTQRWGRIQQLGLVPGHCSPFERMLGPPYDHPAAFRTLGPGEVGRPVPWNELDSLQQAFQATKMAVHAAMIEVMDREIGRIVGRLRSLDLLDDTLILFLSDNGASAEIMVRDDGHDPGAAPGSADTYLCLGPGWSTVANTPFRRHKTWVHEGGIATPLIAHWPAGIADAGGLRHEPGHVIDLVATVLELARSGVKPDGSGRGGQGADPDIAHRGDAPARPGRSLVPAFTSGSLTERGDLWWSHDGHRALRRGDLKVVHAKGSPWELYDLSEDRSETTDRSCDRPQLVRDLADAWQQMEDEFRRSAAEE